MSSGIGSMPGEDFTEALKIALGEADLPWLPELPARGAIAGMIGHTLAVVPELGFDLQPNGWRLTGGAASSGVDHRRAVSLLNQDLDTLEEHTQGFEGAFKVQLAGPWTLAASVELPRGDKILGDYGARRELAEALTLGLVDHVADVRRRMPGADVFVQIDEPALPAVLAGSIPTISGFHRLRSVSEQAAQETLAQLFDATDARTVAHCCAEDVPMALLARAGADAVAVDLDVLGPSGLDALGALVDAGTGWVLGVVPGADPAAPLTTRRVVQRVSRLLDMLGLDPEEIPGGLLLTPACGLAGATLDYTRHALRVLREAAVDFAT